MTNGKFARALALFSLIMVPCYAIFFGLQKSPFKYTFSMIGNWFGERSDFVVWGIVTALLLLFGIFSIYHGTSFKSPRAHYLLYASMLLLVLSVMTPTVDTEPLQNELRSKMFYLNLHGLFAALFAIFLLLSLFLFSRYLAAIDKKLSIHSVRWLLIVSGGSLLTLFLFGMSGIFEIFFFVSLSIFLMVVTNNYFKKQR